MSGEASTTRNREYVQSRCGSFCAAGTEWMKSSERRTCSLHIPRMRSGECSRMLDSILFRHSTHILCSRSELRAIGSSSLRAVLNNVRCLFGECPHVQSIVLNVNVEE